MARPKKTQPEPESPANLVRASIRFPAGLHRQFQGKLDKQDPSVGVERAMAVGMLAVIHLDGDVLQMLACAATGQVPMAVVDGILKQIQAIRFKA